MAVLRRERYTVRMTIKEALQTAGKQLQPRKITCAADRNLGHLEAEILLAHVLKRDRAWLHAHGEKVFSAQFSVHFKKLIARRRKHEPIAYILGEKEFYGRQLKMTRGVLIPRPETELLVDLAKERVAADERLLFWDVGTGCGAVGVTLALEFPHATVLATDSSSRAIELANENAQRYEVADRMHFLRANRLDKTLERLIERHLRRYRLPLVVLGNLPYLPRTDARRLPADIIRYEPKQALFGGQDGLEIIRAYLEQLAASPFEPRVMWLEFDPPAASRLRRLALKLFPRANLRIHKDLARRNRVLEIRP